MNQDNNKYASQLSLIQMNLLTLLWESVWRITFLNRIFPDGSFAMVTPTIRQM